MFQSKTHFLIIAVIILIGLLAPSKYYTQDTSFELLGYGLFEDKPSIKIKQSSSTVLIGKGKSPSKYLVDSIPLKPKMEFGVDFIVTSKTEDNIHLIVKWEFPEEIFIEGEGRTSVSKYDQAVPSGVMKRISLILNQEDLIEGIWKISIDYAPNKTFEKEFFLYWSDKG